MRNNPGDDDENEDDVISVTNKIDEDSQASVDQEELQRRRD